MYTVIMIFEKAIKKSNYIIVFQEPESKDKGFRNKREVLTITAPEVKMQNSVLIIGDDWYFIKLQVLKEFQIIFFDLSTGKKKKPPHHFLFSSFSTT